MSAVTLWGHGKFFLKTDPPVFRLPNGSSVYFFIDYMKTASRAADNVLRVMSEEQLKEQRGNCSQQATPGEFAWNMTLSPETWDETFTKLVPGEGTQLVTVEKPTTLLELVQTYPNSDIYWTSCRSVNLRPVGGNSLRVNDLQQAMGANTSSQWQKDPLIMQLANSWKPSGVSRCTAKCATCSIDEEEDVTCLLFDHHIDQYVHLCAQKHRWGDTDGYDD
ncbi:putative adhesin [Streptomyces sp. NPDC048362]|uniref:putative adhesin n=1 Tax=Streptomyces sp. NPDC048362 TaxID=3365539 RepID=UPI00371A4471